VTHLERDGGGGTACGLFIRRPSKSKVQSPLHYVKEKDVLPSSRWRSVECRRCRGTNAYLMARADFP